MKMFALAAAAAFALVAAPVATAADRETVRPTLNGGPWSWTNAMSLDCLDSDASGNVYALRCNGGGYQRWTHSENWAGDQIRNAQTGRCLDSDTSGKVYTLPCNGGNFQRWSLSYNNAGWQFRNVATSYCLEADHNGRIYATHCNSYFQRWR
ncbi:ricin-type beta-trefoil lectin domain protein [Lysobacter firmicutimachus]|uniref:Ricin-type beta-trefoil lectin domain protein n=1 Tax=Lysobacter firmicutimachus TaxID=1792846 RepID=A0AAU8MW83_9GAMM